MILPIVAYGSPILREKCEDISDTPENREIIKSLIETQQSIKTSVGLALPQINYKLNGFISLIDGKQQVVLNPRIKKYRGEQLSSEGCLSIPLDKFEQSPYINRNDIIEIEYFDQEFRKQTRRLRKFESVVFQHEFDHLQGILFIDYFNPKEKENIKEKLSLIEKGEVKSYYPMIFSK